MHDNRFVSTNPVGLASHAATSDNEIDVLTLPRNALEALDEALYGAAENGVTENMV